MSENLGRLATTGSQMAFARTKFEVDDARVQARREGAPVPTNGTTRRADFDHDVGRRHLVPMHPADQSRIEHTLTSLATQSVSTPAVIDGARSWSYSATAAMVATNAARLRAHGLSPGDRVLIFLDKSIESVVALYAVWTVGAIAVPANEGLHSRQLRHLLDDSGAALLVSNARKLARLDPATTVGVDHMEIDIDARGTAALAFAPAGNRPLGGGRVPAAILYTSGSTGRPKGILISHANLIAGARIVAGYLGMRCDERVLSVLPFSFDYGLNQLLTTVMVGATLVLQRSHFPPDICRSLLAQRITLMAGVPALWIQLMDRHSPYQGMAFPELRILTNSGGAFPDGLVDRYRTHLPHARIFLMYGLSEAFRSTFLPPELIDRKPGAMGKAIPETEVFVLATGDSGAAARLCADGEPGELVHRGPTVALGYWRNPEATAERFRPDPFAPGSGETVVFSGDVVQRDAEGFLFFVGRRDQLIKTQGFRVSPEEVEEILYASGMVTEAAVCGVADASGDTAIVAHVVLADLPDFSADSLLAFCRREMPSYMVPKMVRRHASLPHTGSGKIDRKALAQ